MVLRTEGLIGPAEAGRRLNVSPDRIRQLARAKILDSISLSDDSDRLVFTIEAVNKLAKQRARRE